MNSRQAANSGEMNVLDNHRPLETFFDGYITVKRRRRRRDDKDKIPIEGKYGGDDMEGCRTGAAVLVDGRHHF